MPEFSLVPLRHVPHPPRRARPPRFSSCRRKIAYASIDQAEHAKQASEEAFAKPFRVYVCQYCYAYHLTSSPEH